MANKPILQRIAQSLGLESLSEEEFAVLDVKAALKDRRVAIKAARGRPQDG